MNRKFIWIIIAVVGLTYGARTAASASNCDSQLTAKITSELAAGKKVMIVAWEDHQPCSDGDSNCADWTDGLNHFQRVEKDEVVLFKITPGLWPSVVHVHGDESVPPQSSLFLKTNSAALFHAGAIREPRIYIAVDKIWRDQYVTAALLPFAPEMVPAIICGQNDRVTLTQKMADEDRLLPQDN